jgi:hypothetical protein
MWLAVAAVQCQILTGCGAAAAAAAAAPAPALNHHASLNCNACHCLQTATSSSWVFDCKYHGSSGFQPEVSAHAY